MIYVLAEFVEKDQLIRGIQALKAAGASTENIDLFSEEPVELRRGILDRPTKMSLVSVLGAAVFGGLATTFVWWAQHNYAVNTGGMPTYSPWATGVISYEMTMLGAALATFGWFLWESGLMRKHDRTAPVPEAAPGSVVLRLRCDGEQGERFAGLLEQAGAIAMETKERR
jgi:hypothetical protein